MASDRLRLKQCCCKNANCFFWSGARLWLLAMCALRSFRIYCTNSGLHAVQQHQLAAAYSAASKAFYSSSAIRRHATVGRNDVLYRYLVFVRYDCLSLTVTIWSYTGQHQVNAVGLHPSKRSQIHTHAHARQLHRYKVHGTRYTASSAEAGRESKMQKSVTQSSGQG